MRCSILVEFMVKTSSTMLPLGTFLPSFDLPLVGEKVEIRDDSLSSTHRINSGDLGDKPVLIMVLCAHCPFVKNIEGALTDLNDEFGDEVDFIAVASNSPETHPEDGPKFLAEQKNRNKWSFPYLLDSDQSLAKSLKAACTPDFFIFSSARNEKQELLYRGQLDDSRPGNGITPTGSDVRSALIAVLDFKKVALPQKPSIGCNIKWIPGLEPAWF